MMGETNGIALIDVVSLISLIASLASLILAIVAIWLALYFYKESTKLSKETTEAANSIQAGVDHLEKLFDRFYADTFSMMQETFADMRRQLWPDNISLEEEEKRIADEQIEVIRSEFKAALTELLNEQNVTADKVASLTQDVSDLADKAITESREVAIRKNLSFLQRKILLGLRLMIKRGDQPTISKLVQLTKASEEEVRTEIKDLQDLGYFSLLTNAEIEKQGLIIISKSLDQNTRAN